MEIPKSIIYKKRRYELVKEYPSFILYRDVQTGTRTSFQRYDLGMVKEIMPRTKLAKDKKNIW